MNDRFYPQDIYPQKYKIKTKDPKTRFWLRMSIGALLGIILTSVGLTMTTFGFWFFLITINTLTILLDDLVREKFINWWRKKITKTYGEIKHPALPKPKKVKAFDSDKFHKEIEKNYQFIEKMRR